MILYNDKEFLLYQFPFTIIIAFVFYILFYFAIMDKYFEKPSFKDVLLVIILHFFQTASVYYLNINNRPILAWTLILIPAVFYGLYRKYQNKQKHLKNLKYWQYLTQQNMKNPQEYANSSSIPPVNGGNFNPMLHQGELQQPQQPHMNQLPKIQQSGLQDSHFIPQNAQGEPQMQQHLQPHLNKQYDAQNEPRKQNQYPADIKSTSLLDNTFYDQGIGHVKSQDTLDYADMQSNNMNVSAYDLGSGSYQQFSAI